MTFSMLH